jgi:predicted XRE-type DNA-binding protein
MSTKMIRSSANVFRDLGFGREEAEHLRIRSDLMIAVHSVIEERNLTQARAAALFGVSQPRVSDLVRGKIERFSIDTLVEMLDRAGLRVDLSIRSTLASRHSTPSRRRRSVRTSRAPRASA